MVIALGCGLRFREFDSHRSNFFCRVLQLVEGQPLKLVVVGSIPTSAIVSPVSKDSLMQLSAKQ